jgi:mRNA interferase MazF
MRAGDIVTTDFGIPEGSEPGFIRPAVIVSADLVLEMNPRTIHVVPLTSNTRRRLPTEILLVDNNLNQTSAAQAHLCTVVAISRIKQAKQNPTNIGPAALSQIRSIIADMLDV